MRAQSRGEGPSRQQDGGKSRGSAIQGGSLADAFDQVVGNETHVKPTVVRLGDEAGVTFGKDQGVDAGGDQIVEQVACVLGCGANGDGRAQGAVLGRALNRNPPADWLRDRAPQVGRSRWRNAGWRGLFF